MKKPIKIAISGGAGQIAYSLLFAIASGACFGTDQEVSLHILEIKEALNALQGVKMELEDCAFPLLKEVIIGDDPYAVFKDVDWALLIGAKPRGPGMERKDLLGENMKIFIEQGKALNQAASRNVKVLVVGNPCNTNCWVAQKHAPELNPNNFFAMTRLDQNRAVFQLADKAKVPIKAVSKMAIWGNHSATQVPDFLHAEIDGKAVTSVIPDKNWLENDFVSIVQKRGAAIIAKRGKSSAASAANAIIDSIRDLFYSTPENQWFSIALNSKGNPYLIEDDLVFSFPCKTNANGNVEIVSGLEFDDYLKNRIKLTTQELLEERELVGSICQK